MTDQDADAMKQELRDVVEMWEDFADDNMGSDSRLVHGYGRATLTCAAELELLLDRYSDLEPDQ